MPLLASRLPRSVGRGTPTRGKQCPGEHCLIGGEAGTARNVARRRSSSGTADTKGLRVMSACVQDLAERIGGRLRLGRLPPLGGPWEPVTRIVVQAEDVQPGDLYWPLDLRGAKRAEEAYLRGALGVVAMGRSIEPFPGRYAVVVDDARWALWLWARDCRRREAGSVAIVTGPEAEVAGELARMLAERAGGEVKRPAAGEALAALANHGTKQAALLLDLSGLDASGSEQIVSAAMPDLVLGPGMELVSGAYAMGRLLNLPPEAIAAAMSEWRPEAPRVAVTNVGGVWVVHGPSGTDLATLDKAVGVLRELPCGGERMAVCNATEQESGRLYSSEFWKDFAEAIVACGGVDRLLACGSGAQRLAKAAHAAGLPEEAVTVTEDVGSLCAAIRRWTTGGDALLAWNLDARALGAAWQGRERKAA